MFISFTLDAFFLHEEKVILVRVQLIFIISVPLWMLFNIILGLQFMNKNHSKLDQIRSMNFLQLIFLP